MVLADAVEWAEEHLFDRNSVVLECQVWQEALGRARGESFSLPELLFLTLRRRLGTGSLASEPRLIHLEDNGAD
jgi:hypothetical protein